VTAAHRSIHAMKSIRDRVPPDQLEFSFSRAGGPGGQNVNKVSSRVTLWFDLGRATGLTEAEKHRLRVKLQRRISKDGVLFVVASAERTQAANRRAAVDRLYELLEAALRTPRIRRPTQVPASSKRHRREAKRRTSEKRQSRGQRPDASGEG
jgi:ribosome-associated protein